MEDASTWSRLLTTLHSVSFSSDAGKTVQSLWNLKLAWNDILVLRPSSFTHANKGRKDLLTGWPCCSVYCDTHAHTRTHTHWGRGLQLLLNRTHFLCWPPLLLRHLCLLPLFHPFHFPKNIFVASPPPPLHHYTHFFPLSTTTTTTSFSPVCLHCLLHLFPPSPLWSLVWTSRLCLLCFSASWPLCFCSTFTSSRCLLRSSLWTWDPALSD